MCFHGVPYTGIVPTSFGRYQRIERGLANQWVENEVPLYKLESFPSSGRKRKSNPSNWSSFLAGWCFSLPFTSLVSKVRWNIGHQLRSTGIHLHSPFSLAVLAGVPYLIKPSAQCNGFGCLYYSPITIVSGLRSGQCTRAHAQIGAFSCMRLRSSLIQIKGRPGIGMSHIRCIISDVAYS